MNTILNKKNIAFLVLLLGAMVTLVGCNTGDTDGTVISKTDTNTNDTTEVVEESNTNTAVEVAVNTNETAVSEVVSEETNTTEVTTSEEQSDIPADWVKYENEEYGFSFYHPGDWTLHILDGIVESKFLEGEKIKMYEWTKDDQAVTVVAPEGEFDSDRFITSTVENSLIDGRDVKKLSTKTHNAYIIEEHPIEGSNFRIELLTDQSTQNIIINSFEIY